MARTLLLFGLALVLLIPRPGSAEEVDSTLLRGFEQAYNLDYDEAVATLLAAAAADPTSPAVHRSLAAITWMRILFIRGSMTVDDYLGSVNPKNIDMPEPPADLASRFATHSTRALELSEALVKAAPDDTEAEADAQYELGASLALAASYMATVEGKTLPSTNGGDIW